MPAKLTGRVLHADDPGYPDAQQGFAARCDYTGNAAKAIVFAQNAQDVVHAIHWAKENKTPVRVRSGRHSFEGYSSLVKDGLIIDVSELLEVSIDSEGQTAWVGAGLDCLELTEQLAESGFGMPLATGPSVGIAGLVQGGGFGMTSRLFGLACDNALEFEIVNAGGQVLTASAKEHPDLYWGLRGGGGGNFGVVTRVKFKLHKMADVGVFNIQYRWDDFIAVVDAWQKWGPEVDDRITSLISIHVDRTITIQGQYTAADQDFPLLNGLLQPVLEIPGVLPVNSQVMLVPFLQGAHIIFGVDPMNPTWALRVHDDRQLFKSASALAPDIFPTEAIQMIKTALENVPQLSAPPSQPSMIQLLGGGGFAGRVPIDETAVYHRKAKFVVQYDGYWTAPEDAQPTIDWVNNLRRSMLPYAQGGYVNYHDSALGATYLEDYYGTNSDRLKQVKAKYDPENFFSFAQSIPVSK